MQRAVYEDVRIEGHLIDSDVLRRAVAAVGEALHEMGVPCPAPA